MAVGLLWWLGGWILRRPAATEARRPCIVGRVGGRRRVFRRRVGRRGHLGGRCVGGCRTIIGAWAYAGSEWQSYFFSMSLAGVESRAYGSFVYPIQQIFWNLWENLRLNLLSFSLYPDRSALLGYSGHLVNSFLAPLLLLSIGGLLISLDSAMGWLLLAWFGSGLVVASAEAVAAPSWPVLLPLLPAVGLMIAFALDRARMVILETIGTWAVQATVYAAMGLIIGAGLLNWATYYQFAQVDGDLPSYIGRAYRAVEKQAQAVALITAHADAAAGLQADPVVRFLKRSRGIGPDFIDVGSNRWPAQLPPGARLLVSPGEIGLLGEVQQRYPGGALTIKRDLHADPVLYIYDLPISSQR